MPQLEFTPEDIPIPQNKQETLYQRWVDPELIETGQEEYNDEVVEVLRREQGYWLIPRYEVKNYEDSYELFEELANEALDELPNNSTKKLKIVTLKLVFGDSIACPSNSLITYHVRTDMSYINDFEYYPSEEKVVQEKPISHTQRKRVKNRDERCVRCGEAENLTIHHIIPRTEGGSNSLENLVVLCDSCHKEAHPNWSSTVYDSVDGFWSWVQK